MPEPRAADDIWRAVAADIDAMHAPFGGAPLSESVEGWTLALMRIAASAGYRLATDDQLERLRPLTEAMGRDD